MDYWKGPHSGIISATPGFEEYRQIHLAETNPGVWPADGGIETAILADRKIDGVAEVTFKSVLGVFRKFLHDEIVPGLAGTSVLKELRTQVFMRWNQRLWNTPDVAHDNPIDQRFHASLVLGFTDADARGAWFAGEAVRRASARLSAFVSAVHAYEVSEALTYVKNGNVLPHYQR